MRGEGLERKDIIEAVGGLKSCTLGAINANARSWNSYT